MAGHRRPGPTAKLLRLFLGIAPRLAVRRLTARWRALPNLFVVGAVKCGTTSMSAYLARHPAYVPAMTKELLYLQDLPGLAGNEAVHPLYGRFWGRYAPDLASYRKFFPLRSRMAARAAALGPPVYTGDHTPFYLYCPTAARRIRDFSPEARILILLRHPVERAFAEFNMHRIRNPLETRSFAQAVDDELAGGVEDFRRRYLYKSVYAPHVRRWRELFPAGQVLVLKSEELFDPETTARVMERTFLFLGLEPAASTEHRAHNKGSYEDGLEPELRRRLEEYFEPHNRELYRELGFDLGWDGAPR